jgi:dTDP-4-dehydrorhamnose reductase
MESSRRLKVLITGVSGLLGSNLAYYSRDIFEVAGIYLTHPIALAGVSTKPIDILSRKDIQACLDEFSPDIVIHCAGLANIDLCEENPELAKRINVFGTKNIVDSLAGRSAKLIYISTDSVYDGQKGLFKETDPINPQNYYGETKVEGELEALRRESSLVLRTNFFGWNIQDKMSLGEWVIDCLKNHRPLKGFRDVFFSSMYTIKLAPLIHEAIAQDLKGVYNCASRDCVSKYDFAVALARRFDFDPSLVEPVSITNGGLKARRGRNLSLDSGKLSRALQLPMPSISDSTEDFYRDYASGLPKFLKKCAFLNRSN